MITRLKHHDKCNVGVFRMPNNKHYARLFCKDCGTHIQWLSKKDYLALKSTFKAVFAI